MVPEISVIATPDFSPFLNLVVGLLQERGVLRDWPFKARSHGVTTF